jgi:hypothetical protein
LKNTVIQIKNGPRLLTQQSSIDTFENIMP